MSSTPKGNTVVQSTAADQSIIDSRLPEELQAQLEQLFPGETPTTFHELIQAWSQNLDLEGGNPSVEDFRVDDGQFCCSVGSMVSPFVTEEPTELDAECPQTGTDVTVEVTSDGVEVTPDGAVVSLGLSTDLPEYDAEEESEFPYGKSSPYVGLFASGDDYEEWASTESDAVTVGLPVEDAHELAHEVYRAAERKALTSSAFHCNCC